MAKAVKIFQIQRFSLHDGEGIRSSVFFNGCPLRCRWCANPESRLPLSDPRNGGKLHTVDEVLQVVLRDKPFYDKSGGGVTLTGGEACLYPEFVLELTGRLHDSGVRVALETSAAVPEKVFTEIFGAMDFVYADCKHYDDARHREGTGHSNRGILRNLGLLTSSGTPCCIRIPVIPGYNDGAEDAKAFGALLRDLGVRQVQLLPFHQFGEKKYETLGLSYDYAGVRQMRKEELRPYCDEISSFGIQTRIGGA